jgi:uncharacterized protein (TIGR02145 family)
MKSLFAILSAVLIYTGINAQVPQKMSYQAVIRNTSDQLVANQTIGIKISILKDSPSGSSVYTETQTPSTNDNGLVSIVFGGGTGFDAIDWSTGTYYLKTEIDPSGGSSYSITGTSQILSVPYALHAKTADNGFKGTGISLGDMLYWNGISWVNVPVGTTDQILTVQSGIPVWKDASVVLNLYEPTITLLPATDVQMNSANIHGIIDANGFATMGILFEYGTTTSFGQLASTGISLIPANTTTNVNATLTGLLANTTYYFRLGARNAIGSTLSGDLTFITPGAAPSVTTSAVTGTTITETTLNGTINANGFSTTVTFEYGLTTAYGSSSTATQSPVTGNSNTNVSATLSGLATGTTFHYRVIATNSLGSTTGNDMTFTTLGAIPSASTTAVTSISTSGATINGTVNANLLSTTVIFEYGLTPGYGSTITATQSPVTGSINTIVSGNLIGLAVGTTYHYRVQATNSLGTTNGNDMTFITAPETINDVDGNTYNVVTIGTQVWMAENLETTKYRNGDLIGTTSPVTLDITGETTPKYQWAAKGDESNVTTYGRLYTWHAVTDSRNVCPTGWHVPTEVEWTSLVSFLGGIDFAGGKLKEAGTTHWIYPNTDATNEVAFKALPGGYRVFNGDFSESSNGFWWSSSNYSASDAWRIGMYSFTANVNTYYLDKKYALSIRCIRDN